MEKLVTKRVSNLQKNFEGQKYVTAQKSNDKKKLKVDEDKKEHSKNHKKMFSNVFGKLFKKKNKDNVEDNLQDGRTDKVKPKKNNAKKINLNFWLKNNKNLLVLSIFGVLLIVFSLLMFANNDYFNFIKRPTVIARGFSVTIMIVLQVLFCVVWFVLQNNFARHKNEKELADQPVQNEENTNGKIPPKEMEIKRAYKSNIFEKLFKNRKKQSKNAKNDEFLVCFVQILFLTLFVVAFAFKCLWCCVGTLFAGAFASFLQIVKSQKTFANMFVSASNFVVSLSHLMCFYFVFLLN